MSQFDGGILPYDRIKNSYTDTTVNLLCALEQLEKCSQGTPREKDLVKQRARILMQQLVDSYLTDHRRESLTEQDMADIAKGIETIARSYNASVAEHLRVFPNGFNRTHLCAIELTGRALQR